jgi:hypothetical protein
MRPPATHPIVQNWFTIGTTLVCKEDNIAMTSLKLSVRVHIARFPKTLSIPSVVKRLGLSSVTIRELQDYSLAIWKSRNDVLHENDDGRQAILQTDLH